MKPLRQKLAVVHHVVVRQHHAFRQAGSSARVLDVGHIVDRHVVRQPSFSLQQRWPLRCVEVDRVFQCQVEPVSRSPQNLLVVGALILVPQKQRLHLRPCQRELQLVRTVGGIYIHQRRPGPRAAHVHHHPLDAVGGPQAHAVPAANPQRPKSARHAVGLSAQLSPCQPLLLVPRRYRQSIRETICRSLKQVANRQFQQRPCRSARIALGRNLLFNGHGSAFVSAMKRQFTPPAYPQK